LLLKLRQGAGGSGGGRGGKTGRFLAGHDGVRGGCPGQKGDLFFHGPGLWLWRTTSPLTNVAGFSGAMIWKLPLRHHKQSQGGGPWPPSPKNNWADGHPPKGGKKTFSPRGGKKKKTRHGASFRKKLRKSGNTKAKTACVMHLAGHRCRGRRKLPESGGGGGRNPHINEGAKGVMGGSFTRRGKTSETKQRPRRGAGYPARERGPFQNKEKRN